MCLIALVWYWISVKRSLNVKKRSATFSEKTDFLWFSHWYPVSYKQKTIQKYFHFLYNYWPINRGCSLLHDTRSYCLLLTNTSYLTTNTWLIKIVEDSVCSASVLYFSFGLLFWILFVITTFHSQLLQNYYKNCIH